MCFLEGEGWGWGMWGGCTLYIESRNLSGFRDLSVINCPAETLRNPLQKTDTFEGWL
jgi:hypothetical protein